MAPRKPAADKKATMAKKVATKKSEDKVIKRPARGYHKFKNGLLNVTPKGSEKEITKSNQESPLLRLPSEIRNEIWKFVLGGKVYRAKPRWPNYMSKLTVSPTEPKNTMALLRTCRQIYAEAALIPLTLNSFAFEDLRLVSKTLRKLKAHHRKQITVVSFELFGPKYTYFLEEKSFYRGRLNLSTLLPGLNEFRVRVFSVPSLDETGIQQTQNEVKRLLAPRFEGTSVDVKVEQTMLTWESYDGAWYGIVRDDKGKVAA